MAIRDESPAETPGAEIFLNDLDSDEWFTAHFLYGNDALQGAPSEKVREFQALRLGMTDEQIFTQVQAGVQKLLDRGYLRQTGPADSLGYRPFKVGGRLVRPMKLASKMDAEEQRKIFGGK